jgi:HEAT repeat protein
MSVSRTHFKWTKAGCILVAIGAASLLVGSRPAREPEYDGLPLSDYLRSLTYSQVRLERSARDAIRAIGPNAVPHLIKILDARESRFKNRFNEMANRQSFIRFRFEPLEPRQVQAAMACQELGPIAAPAIPSLGRLIDDPQLGSWAVAALAEIGPQTFPMLTNALSSRWPATRFAAVGHLRLARPRERAVPPLLTALGSQESNMRSIAAESLGALGVRTPEVVAALEAHLDDPEMSVRITAARSLGWCGSAATSSVPKLLELYRGQEGMPEQQCIGEALASIDPAAMQRAGLSK